LLGGRNSRFCKSLEVGDNIRIWGRLQSREYQKKLSDDEVIKKVAYEVSISKMEKVTKDGENTVELDSPTDEDQDFQALDAI